MLNVDFLMPQGMCFQWREGLLLSHVISDTIIALAYLSISLIMGYIASSRSTLRTDAMYIASGLLVFTCGLMHMMDVWTIWHPDYYLQGFIKAITALFSILAAHRLYILAPVLLKLPTIAEYEDHYRKLDEEISARKSMEESLQKQRMLTQQLEDTLNEFALVSVSDVSGVIIYANSKFCEVSGFTESELLGNTHKIINSGHHDAEFFHSLWKTITSGKTWRGEVRNKRKDGSYYWVDAMVRPIYADSTQKPYRYVSVRREITAEVTNREKMTWAKQDAEQMLWNTLNNLTAYAAIKDINGKMIYANPMVCRLFGKSQDEILEYDDIEFFDRETGVSIREDELKVLRDGVAVTQEEVIVPRGSGKARFVLSSKVPLYHENGSIKGLLVISNDITEQKNSKHRVEELAQFNQSVLDSLGARLCVLDEQGIIIAANQAWLEANTMELPYQANLQVGSNYLDFCDAQPPILDTQNKIAAGIRLVMQGEHDRYTFEYSCHAADNTTGNGTLWYLLSINRFKGDQVRVVVSQTDITERKRLGRALHDKELLLMTVLENIGASIHMKDLDSKYLYANTLYANRYQRTPSAMIGLSDYELMSQEQAERLIEQDKRVINLGIKHEEMETFLSEEGQEENYFWSIKLPIYHADGNIYSLLGMSLDVTDRKRLENEKIQYIEKAAQVKSDFLANVSHEIRTPMNSVLGVTELLQDTPLSTEQSHYLDILQFACQHVLCLINDMLELSKIEAGHWVIERKVFNLSAILKAVLKGLMPLASNKGLSLTLNLDATIPLIYWGSPLRLGQIITNLVGNAIKFTAQGGIEVSVQPADDKTLVTEPNQVALRFAVIDSGIGIPIEHQARIFKAFEQIEQGTELRTEGTGLGLTISSSLVYLMGGQLRVQSTQGVGSTFYFELPLQICDTQECEQATETSKTISLMGKHILLVEDNEINRELVETRLNKLGCVVTTAEHGQRALDIMATQAFDLVLLDMRMPIMDGPTTARLIRQREAKTGLPRTVIIALTANAHEQDIQTCLNAGMDGHIGKPFTVEMLMQGVADAYATQGIQESFGNAISIPDEYPVFDEKSALDMAGYDTDLLRGIIQKFVERYPDLMHQIRQALYSDNMSMGRDAAHTLKGNAGYLCALEFKHYATLMETLFRDNKLEQAKSTLLQMEEGGERLIKTIQAYRNRE